MQSCYFTDAGVIGVSGWRRGFPGLAAGGVVVAGSLPVCFGLFRSVRSLVDYVTDHVFSRSRLQLIMPFVTDTSKDRPGGLADLTGSPYSQQRSRCRRRSETRGNGEQRGVKEISLLYANAADRRHRYIVLAYYLPRQSSVFINMYCIILADIVSCIVGLSWTSSNNRSASLTVWHPGDNDLV